jgi:drug/metabolite transporter (DMT)-like permease
VTAIEVVTGWTRAAGRRARGSVGSHAALLAAVLLWSANAAFVKVGVANVRPIPFTTARFAVGAIYLVIANEAGKRTEAVVFTTWCVAVAMLVFLPMAAVQATQGPDDWAPALPAILYSGVLATAVAYALYSWALPRVGVTETSMYTYLQPVCGVAIGAIFLHEPVGPLEVVGGAAILLAAYLGSWSRVKEGPRGQK